MQDKPAFSVARTAQASPRTAAPKLLQNQWQTDVYDRLVNLQPTSDSLQRSQNLSASRGTDLNGSRRIQTADGRIQITSNAGNSPQTFKAYLDRCETKPTTRPLTGPEFEYLWFDFTHARSQLVYINENCGGIKLTVEQFTSMVKFIKSEKGRLEAALKLRKQVPGLDMAVDAFVQSAFVTKTFQHQFKVAMAGK